MLIGAQMAFCMFLLVAGGLFVVTFQQLLQQPLGFSDRHLLVMPVEMRGRQTPEKWMQVDDLRQTTGVQSVALAGWAPLTGNRWRSAVRVEGVAFGPNSPHFVGVSSPGYFETMAMTMAHGRDFRPGDTPPRTSEQQQPLAGVGIVNESFAKAYFRAGTPW